VFSLLAAAILAAGCASNSTAPSAAAQPQAAPEKAAQTHTAEQANTAIAAAEKSAAAAAAVDYEWRDTGKLIKEAKEAAAGGDFDKAVKLATKADQQGELAVKQEAIEAAKMKKM